MDEIIDKKTAAALLKALKDLNAYSQRLQETREQRLWKTVDIPCSLYNAIYRLPKGDIDIIRKNYGFKSLSSLRKAELAAELARLIPLRFKQVLYTLDQGRYDFIKTIVKNEGIIPDVGISASHAELFTGFSIAYTGADEDGRIIFMPAELMDIFVQTDGSKLESIVHRNTEWIQLTHGLLFYYGVMGVWPVKEKIEELTGQEIDFQEFLNVMFFACDFYGQVRCTSYGFKDDRVTDAGKIVEEHRARPDVGYYHFTKMKLLEASAPDYVDKTPEMNSFIDFLVKHTRLKAKDIKEIALQIITIINVESQPAPIFQYLERRIKCPSLESAQQAMDQIKELYNNTRQWMLKGYSPNELFEERRKYLKPLPAEPTHISQTNLKVNAPVSVTKIGRNEACPCGSGKKYKKCCGK